MMRAAVVFTLVLAACGSNIPPEERGDSPDAVICRQQARNSPEVREAGREFNAENLANVRRVGEERRIAELRAFNDCMRRRGAALPGGVEPIRRNF